VEVTRPLEAKTHSEFPEHGLCHILLVKASHKASLDSRVFLLEEEASGYKEDSIAISGNLSNPGLNLCSITY
jgi:hypothetical protein